MKIQCSCVSIERSGYEFEYTFENHYIGSLASEPELRLTLSAPFKLEYEFDKDYTIEIS